MAKKHDEPLTVAEEFYVQNHFESMSEEELAADLGKPLDSVRQCVHKCKMADSRVSKLLARHPSGAIAMTGGASAAADEKSKGSKQLVAMIQAASDAGDYEEAARLKGVLQEDIKKKAEAKLNPRNTDYIHRIPNRKKYQDMRR